MQIFWCAACHTFFLILSRYEVFFNYVTDLTILKKYTNSDAKNTFTRKYTNRSKYKLNLKLLS